MGAVRARYLVFFQYLGTAFNGVMAVRGSQSAVGVQNFLEEAAERLNSMERIKFTISSRTDAGVHALSNSAHLDVQRRSGLPPFSPKVLTQALNTHLRHPAIRVVQAFRVPNDFHARHTATSRTYLYRLATGCRWPDQLSVFERNLCWALQADLDVAAMQEAAQHLLGTHDFSAFQSAGSPARSSVRTLRRATVSPGPASPFVNPQENRSLRFWNLEFESQSFLYRQVRRMTAVLVAVGLGVLTPTQVKVILESKDPLGRDQTRVAPAHGLFLMAMGVWTVPSGKAQPIQEPQRWTSCVKALGGGPDHHIPGYQEAATAQKSEPCPSVHSQACPTAGPRFLASVPCRPTGWKPQLALDTGQGQAV